MVNVTFLSGLDDATFLGVDGAMLFPEISINGCIHVGQAMRHKDINVGNFILYNHKAATIEFPDSDVVFNTISNPDRNILTLTQAVEICGKLGVPTINRPENIVNSARHKLTELTAGLAAVLAPKTIKAYLSSGREVTEMVEKGHISLPLLIRPIGGHGGAGLVKVDSMDQVRKIAVPGSAIGLYYLSEFVDTRGADGFYRKFRVFVIDGRIFPRHRIVGESWNVHMATRRERMQGDKKLTADEEEFLGHFPERIEGPLRQAIVQIAGRLGLDYMGIDAALDGDGRLVIFEANANMNAFQQAMIEDFPYLAGYVKAIREATEKMILDKAAGTH